ncbi:MAG: hypothetical protein FWC39_09490 [Bacteroidetes bacterium]|nr:hypothetical protein [Bacteroidota bacterium]
MDTNVLIALIGGASAVIAAIITALVTRGKKNTNGTTVRTGDIHTGGDTVIAGGNATLIKEENNRFFSKSGREILKQVTRAIIPDDCDRMDWNAFDLKFTTKCIKDSHRGWVFDGDAFQEFRKSSNDYNFFIGVNVYAECCKRMENKTESDYLAFNRMSQVYLNARKVLNPEKAAAAEWWLSTGKKSAICDDCSRELFPYQGYMVSGTVFVIGDRRITDNSPSLLCDDCFATRGKFEQES